MHSRIWAIARYTLLEHLRGRMATSAGLLVVLGLMLARLLDGVALTESAAVQSTLVAALLRPAMVLLMATSVIVSQVREGSDRTRDWLLALPMPRSHWLGGRLGGHLMAAVMLGLTAGLTLALPAGPLAGFLWACSLALELMLCTCMAMFLSISLDQTPAALLVFAGWYVLARGMAALQLVAGMPLLADGSLFMEIAPHGLQWLGLLLPRLDLFATAPLLPDGKVAIPALQWLAGQAAIYGGLLAIASLLDLNRREW